MNATEGEVLSALISRQDHVVSRAQALAAGISTGALRHRLRQGGPWTACLPGVYLTVTGNPTQAQRETAAILYGGPHSVLTGAAALNRHRLPAPHSAAVDILIPGGSRRQSISY